MPQTEIPVEEIDIGNPFLLASGVLSDGTSMIQPLRPINSLTQMNYLIEPPEPGVYRDVPMEIYNRWNCARSSTLSAMVRGATPYEIHTGADNETSAKGMGNVLHLATWEPELFTKRVEIWTATKTRALAFKAHLAELPEGHYLVTADEALAIGQMILTMKASSRIQKYLRAVTERELSVVFDLPFQAVKDEQTGESAWFKLRTKARLDGLAPRIRRILDLKCTRNAKPRAFSYSMKEFGYHHQGAIYLEAARIVAEELKIEEPTHYVILAVQNEPPWRCMPYQLNQKSLETAWTQLAPAIATMAECYATGTWPDLLTNKTLEIGLPEE